MDYQQAIDYLDSHIGLGMRPGLSRMAGLLDMMGNPESAYPIIHITGTNGKTSIARMATSLLAAHGLRVGTYISPHLERVEERIALDGVAASPESFAEAVSDIEPFVALWEERTENPPTYFELTAALAFSYFATNSCDVGVIEVGLGGRLDATNAADGAVAVVSGISLEHTSWLGHTVDEIAVEKLAIAKPESILITGSLPDAVLPLAAERARELGIPHRRYGAEFHPEAPTMAVGGWAGSVSGIYATYDDLFLPLHGRHQFDNLAVAIAAVEELTGRSLDPDGVVEGTDAITSPGRLEVLQRQPLVLIDGAHNVQGCQVLADTLDEEFPRIGWTLVIGAMIDKDLDGMLSHLAGRVERVIATAVDYDRAVSAEELAASAKRTLGVPVEIEPNVAAAVDRAIASATDECAVLVAGSLYVAGEARSHLLEKNS